MKWGKTPNSGFTDSRTHGDFLIMRTIRIRTAVKSQWYCRKGAVTLM